MVALGCILSITTLVAFNQTEFGSGYGLQPSTYSQLTYIGAAAPRDSSIFTNFAVGETLLYFGLVNVFGLSDYAYTPHQFAAYSNSIFANDTASSISTALLNITGSNNAIFLYQSQEQHAVPMETDSYIIPNQTFLSTFDYSFDKIYASEYAQAFII